WTLGAALLVRWRLDAKTLALLAALGAISTSLLVVQQSRLAILSAVIGLVVVLAFACRLSVMNTLAAIRPAAIVILPVLAYLATPYLSQLAELDLADAGNRLNIEVRYRTIAYFWDQFLLTAGVGFGTVSYGMG